LADDSPPPVSVGELAARLKRRKVTWREWTKGEMSARFAWVRVWPGHDWRQGGYANAEAIWLLVEEQADGTIKYALSNLPADTSCRKAVRLWKSRWPVEQGYQLLKEELGLDHFEGRTWRGLHHHALMTLICFAFLQNERLRENKSAA
jgi:SRSO17 transposase